MFESSFAFLLATRVGCVPEGAGDDSNGRADSGGFFFPLPLSCPLGLINRRKEYR
jgi:hypothetical protein